MQIDAKLKSDFAYFCECCGITASDAVYMLAKLVPFSNYLGSAGGRPAEAPKTDRVTIRMDRGMQDEFVEACDEIGTTRSALVRVFFVRCLNEGKIAL